MTLPSAPIDAQVLEEMPGFYIRRLQQIAVAIFLEETQDFGITPVQFAALTA
ncbi:MAG: MarR family transcriptional regulator, partial [Aquabacterium sp.]